jgi:hypothetical protein
MDESGRIEGIGVTEGARRGRKVEISTVSGSFSCVERRLEMKEARKVDSMKV